MSLGSKDDEFDNHVTDGQEGSVILPHPLLLTTNVSVSQVL